MLNTITLNHISFISKQIKNKCTSLKPSIGEFHHHHLVLPITVHRSLFTDYCSRRYYCSRRTDPEKYWPITPSKPLSSLNKDLLNWKVMWNTRSPKNHRLASKASKYFLRVSITALKVGYCNVVLDCFHYYVHYVLYVDMMITC